jgi:hypothetical protein
VSPGASRRDELHRVAGRHRSILANCAAGAGGDCARPPCDLLNYMLI